MTARELLHGARQKLHAYQSVKARLIQTVVVGDRKFRASGAYLQGRDLQLKMSLDLSLGDDGEFKASMLQVCDGEVLWTAHRLGRESDRPPPADDSKKKPGIEQRITRRDVRQILREAARHQQASPALLFAELGLGGISELLGSLEQTMVFGRPRDEQIDGQPFLVVQGRWNLDVLKNFVDEQELEELGSSGDARQLPRLPEHVPDAVRLYFDRDSLFPRRVLYVKQREPGGPLKPMLSLSFVDVVLNGPVDDNEFNFVPPDKVYPQDVTAKYVKQIRKAAKETKAK